MEKQFLHQGRKIKSGGFLKRLEGRILFFQFIVPWLVAERLQYRFSSLYGLLYLYLKNSVKT
jgi:hypothetical protein